MRAVVIGGGIGGLSAAIALRRSGIEAHAYERTPVLGEIGAGIALFANALAAMKRLDLVERIATVALPDTPAGIRTWDGEVLIGVSERFDGDLNDLCRVMHRADLQTVLLDALGRQHLELDWTCVRVEQDEEGVTAFASDGRQIRGDVLIGADGLNSVIRAQLNGSSAPRYSGYTAWRAVVPFDVKQLRPGESWGAGHRFGQMAIPNERVYWFATANVLPNQKAPNGEKAELLRIFSNWHAPICQLIEATDERTILRNDIFDRPPLAHWTHGRVTLLGDAAHPMTPDLGQGACQAIIDGVVLADCLASSANPAAGLLEYERSRLKIANRLVRMARRVGQVAQWQSAPAVALRRWLVKHIPLHFQQRQMERMIGHSE